VTTLGYDGNTGNLLTTVADAGTSPHFNATTTVAHNALGLPASVRDPVGAVTEFQYDALGNRTAIVADAAGLRRTTAFAYDGVTTSTWDAGRQLGEAHGSAVSRDK